MVSTFVTKLAGLNFKINLDFIPSAFSLVCIYVIKNKLPSIWAKTKIEFALISVPLRDSIYLKLFYIFALDLVARCPLRAGSFISALYALRPTGIASVQTTSFGLAVDDFFSERCDPHSAQAD